MKVTLLASLIILGVGTSFATTTDALQISVNGVIVQIADNGTCVNIAGTGCSTMSNDINVTAGTDTITGTLGGWTLNIVSGTTHSPGLVPFGLDISSLTAVCGGGQAICATHALDIQYSDKGFTPAPASFETDYSATISGTGSTSESAYFSNSNNLFAETNLIGTVGPFTGTNHGVAFGGVGAIAPYSLTLDQVFTDTTGAPDSFSVDGDITGNVPEPAAVMLLGTVLVLCASKLRKHRAA